MALVMLLQHIKSQFNHCASRLYSMILLVTELPYWVWQEGDWFSRLSYSLLYVLQSNCCIHCCKLFSEGVCCTVLLYLLPLSSQWETSVH